MFHFALFLFIPDLPLCIIFAHFRSFRMFHFACGPYQNPADHTVDELFLDSLPMSRFDFMDGDEVHVEFLTEETPHLVAGSIELNL